MSRSRPCAPLVGISISPCWDSGDWIPPICTDDAQDKFAHCALEGGLDHTGLTQVTLLPLVSLLILVALVLVAGIDMGGKDQSVGSLWPDPEELLLDWIRVGPTSGLAAPVETL